MQRGETDGCGLSCAGAVTMIEKGVTKEPLVIMARERTTYYPNSPAITEVVNLTPEQSALLGIMEGLISSKLLWTQPDVPQDRVDFMRHILFDTMLHDEGVVEHLQYKWKDWEIRSPEAYTTVIDSITNIPKAEIETLKELIQSYVR